MKNEQKKVHVEHTKKKASIRSLFMLTQALVLFSPLVAVAALDCGTVNGSFCKLVLKIVPIFNSAIVTLIGLGVFIVAFGILRYINAGADPKRIAEGGRLVLWGTISLFVMISMWGLVNILLKSFFPDTSTDFTRNEQLWRNR